MPEITVQVHGLKELHDSLEELGALAGARVLRSALREAAKPILEGMIATAPVGTETRKVKTKKGVEIEITPGFLKSRIKMKTLLNATGRNKKFKGDAVAKVRVGVFRVPYVAAIEYGASDRGIAPQPFIRPAFHAYSDAALARFSTILAKKIKSAKKRAAKKAAAQ